MNLFESILSWSNLFFLLVLCAFVFARKVHRILPLFTAYVFVLLFSLVVVWLIYRRFGFNSLTAYYSYWASVLLNDTARRLAIAELCRYGLRAYKGVWALVWRLLTVLSILLVLRTVFDAWGQPNRVALYGTTIDRDLDLASIVVLAVLLLFRNYYGIALEPLQRAIAAGVCCICAVDVVVNTILKNIFTGYLLSYFMSNQKSVWASLSPQFEQVSDVWGAVHLGFVMFSMGIWCYALRKPLSEPAAAPELLPVEVYRDLSPAINTRMAIFNNRMLELLKP
jgi:hypothetical protein